MPALDRLGIDPEVFRQSAEDVASDRQNQTSDTFGFKWQKRETYESAACQENTKRWLFEKYCDSDPSRLDEWLKEGRQIILDAGCGASTSALVFFGDRLKNHDYLGVDISAAVDVARQSFKEKDYPGDFLRCNLMEIPVADGSLDMVFSEGVLHHTDNTEDAIKFLSSKLKKSGMFLFYVYVKKAVIREFTDDYVREHLSQLNDEAAWDALLPLTQLGIELGKVDVEIDIPEDIPYLGIKKGKTSLQRFLYYNMLKAFYRPEYSIDEMNHINFDWFRPLNCHRHTPEEVRQFCDDADLDVERLCVQRAGITVVARKR